MSKRKLAKLRRGLVGVWSWFGRGLVVLTNDLWTPWLCQVPPSHRSHRRRSILDHPGYCFSQYCGSSTVPTCGPFSVSSIILVFFSCLPYFSGSRAASDRAQITPLSDASTTAATFHYVGLTDDGSFCTSPNLFTFLSLYCLNIRLFPATNYSAYSDKWYFACPRNYTTVYSVGLL